MPVTLRERKNKDGTTSLYLDIYHAGKRKYEFLHHLQLSAGSTTIDRQKNKEHREHAKRIQVKRAHELTASDYDMSAELRRRVLLLEWMREYIKGYDKKDLRNMEGVYGRFEQFLVEQKKTGLLIKDLDETTVMKFRTALERNCKGEGAKSYFARFKKMLRQAVREKLIATSPAADVKAPKGEADKKNILSLDELKALYDTDTRATEVKRAFLFCCLTGLRWVDVCALAWVSIDVPNRMMRVKQSKTTKTVSVNLHVDALQLLGDPGPAKSKVFELPTANGANKALRLWVERAGIDRKITWHSARHTFGTNLIYYGADIVSASQLLGHSSLTQTQRYVRSAAELKQQAVHNIPSLIKR